LNDVYVNGGFIVTYYSNPEGKITFTYISNLSCSHIFEIKGKH